MARITFSSSVEAITGKLAGSVFQDSYQGFQIRTRVSPRNPQTNFQQLRRGEFAFLQQGWRLLTDTERSTWIDNAPPGMSGINFYLSSNINLTLISLAVAASYESATTPPAFPLSIETLGGGVFNITAGSELTTVPAGTSLLIQSTSEKAPSKIFTNPSMYSPILSLPEGTDLSTAFDISDAWILRFGQFTTAKRICLKSNLISTVNGARSEDSIVCDVEGTPSSSRIIDYDGSFLVDNEGNYLAAFS